MRRLAIAAVATVALGIAPLLAADSPTVLSLPTPRSGVTPYTANLGFFTGIVTMGPQDPNSALPCFNCVNGASVENLGLGLPLTVVSQGAAMTVTVVGQDVSYDGPCTFSFMIRSSPSSPPIQAGSVSGSCYPGVWIAYFPITVSGPTGGYLLQGVIKTRGPWSAVQAGLLITP